MVEKGEPLKNPETISDPIEDPVPSRKVPREIPVEVPLPILPKREKVPA